MIQANFDSLLVARYAVVRGVLWSVFLHPLGSLTESQFLKGVGQTVNLARFYRISISSGLMKFGGGDSNVIRERELIEKLLKKVNILWHKLGEQKKLYAAVAIRGLIAFKHPLLVYLGLINAYRSIIGRTGCPTRQLGRASFTTC